MDQRNWMCEERYNKRRRRKGEEKWNGGKYIIITLNVNRIDSLIKQTQIAKWIKNQNLMRFKRNALKNERVKIKD